MKLSSMASVGLMLALSACVTLPDEPAGQGPFRLQLEPVEQEHLPDDRPQWGLALSGGGLRSALFSIGALKALYDQNALGRVSMISTVSGGGYAAYWLYSQELAGAERSFGTSTFGAGVFPKKVCELITTANFVTFGKMLTRGFYPRRAVRLYDEQLHRTFGRKDSLDQPFRFDQLQSKVSAGQLPYWIVNATLISPKPTGWRDGLYEFTPFFAGNEAYGYAPWNAPPLAVRTAVSISGAALQPLLKQRFAAPNPGLLSRKVVAADGGESENLGALALIRRGIPNVVIVDAEHDPTYRFPAYVNLRDRLAQWGLTLSVGVIEDHLKPGAPEVLPAAVYLGEVRRAGSGGAPITRIRYVKMALPETIAADARDPLRIERGLTADDRFYGAFDAATQDGVTDCSRVEVAEMDLPSWFLYYVGAYGRFMREDSYTRASRQIRWNFVRADFPQYFTPDQSFYQDQAIAFLGLGYLAASELRAGGR